MTEDSHIVVDQSDVTAFLADPATHGGMPVGRIDTYAALVFLAGDTVYKVKRAVRFSYMDFSTLEKRKAACCAELALNRRTAPDIYLRVAAITREADGELALDGAGEPTEWAVVMRRFDQDLLFDRMASRGALTVAHVQGAVTALTRLQRAADIACGPPGDVGDGFGLAGTIAQIVGELGERPDLIAVDALIGFGDALAAALAAIEPLLERRRGDGLVRRGHGDLHLGNLCLFEGRATLFDCIEFNDAIATVDVLYDMAFLLMDLEHSGLRSLANAALNAYVPVAPGGAAKTLEALAALPLMLALRAGIRAMVSAKSAPRQGDPGRRATMETAARSYFDLAEAFLAPEPPRLVAVGGLSGSGKSTLARALAPGLGRASGAIHLRSDAIRKELYGVAETDRLPESAYTAAVSDRVYAEMFARTRLALSAGQAVIVDGVNADPAGRSELRALAAGARSPFTGLWLEAPAGTLKARVTTRHGDASDADAAIVARQLDMDVGPLDWHRIDGAAGAESVLDVARRLLGDGDETG